MGGFQGTFAFLMSFQSNFLNQACALISYPLFLEPNLFKGFGFSKLSIRCFALRVKNSGN